MKKNPYRFISKSVFVFILLLLIMPLARILSPAIVIDGSKLFVGYLPYGLAIAVIYLLGRAAVIPLFLSFYASYFFSYSGSMAAGLALTMLLPIVICAWLARNILGRRWRFNLGNNGIGIRMLLMNMLAPVLSRLLMVIWGMLFPIPENLSIYFSSAINMYTITSLQNMIISAVVFSILFYFPLRMVANPTWARKFYRTCHRNLLARENRLSAIMGFSLLSALLIIFCSPFHHQLIASYLIPLIFILFTWGVTRFTPSLMIILWALSCFLLMYFNQDVLSTSNIFAVTFMASTFIAFTVCLVFFSATYWKNQRTQQRVTALSLTDPVELRPNLRALEHHLKSHPAGTLCYISIGNLEFLGRHYGLTMRTWCRRTLTDTLKICLSQNEGVYLLAGDGILLFLNGEQVPQRLETMQHDLQALELNWQNNVIDLSYAFAFGQFDAERDDLYRLIGQLSLLAKQFASAGGISQLDENGETLIHQASAQLHTLQTVRRAIAQRQIVLYAQPISEVHTHACYYEVLARLVTDEGMLQPETFVPLISAFNLSAAFDRLVTEETVAFIYRHRSTHQKTPRLAINLLPMTLTQTGIVDTIKAIFQRHGVPHESVIFEVTEEQALLNSQSAGIAIENLRHAGFRIAIDDFGTGFANYERVKRLNADIIKIDGIFIKNIENDRLDRLIVKSICDIAREKNLDVVAEYVETDAQSRLLAELGVNYQQGYLIGKPVPLETLAHAPS
ncbi:EAL domain-containing protein [Erwinia sp. 9145]|uniref:EAL domain-containing protein n=1 Tax=Erwinia sp. 9145 TaxID=1500895 RepID=UPI00068FC97F|nr:EAL domain-containing protein [Erwinia sp. 9145]